MSVYVRCVTALNLRDEEWPKEMPAVPRVGDLVESSTEWGPGKVRLVLQVKSVTWRRTKQYSLCGEFNGAWYPELTLSLSDEDWSRWMTLKGFEKWYDSIQRGEL